MKPFIAMLAALVWAGCSCRGDRDIKAGTAKETPVAESTVGKEEIPEVAKSGKKNPSKSKPSRGGDIRDGIIPGFDSKPGR